MASNSMKDEIRKAFALHAYFVSMQDSDGKKRYLDKLNLDNIDPCSGRMTLIYGCHYHTFILVLLFYII